MQIFSKSNAATSGLDQALVIVDAATLSRVAGGLGPHGGWSLTNPSDATGTAGAPALLGPHGGWRSTVFGPHGGW